MRFGLIRHMLMIFRECNAMKYAYLWAALNAQIFLIFATMGKIGWDSALIGVFGFVALIGAGVAVISFITNAGSRP